MAAALRPAQTDFDPEYYRARSSISFEVLQEVDRARPHVLGRTVLDVAAGAGRHAHLLRYYGYDVTSTDYHDNGLPGHVTGDFFEVELPSPYDTVTSFHFIEHLPLEELKRALGRMRELTRQRAILVMPHPRHRDYRKDPTHAHVPLADIRAAVQEAFPRVREARYHNLVNPPLYHPRAWLDGARRLVNPWTFTNVMFLADVKDEPQGPT